MLLFVTDNSVFAYIIESYGFVGVSFTSAFVTLCDIPVYWYMSSNCNVFGDINTSYCKHFTYEIVYVMFRVMTNVITLILSVYCDFRQMLLILVKLSWPLFLFYLFSFSIT